MNNQKDEEIEISSDELDQFEIILKHGRMPNGESRFRLKSAKGDGYIRTEAGTEGDWQKAHYHTEQLETYIV